MTPIIDSNLQAMGFVKTIDRYRLDNFWIKLHKGHVWQIEKSGNKGYPTDVKTMEDIKRFMSG